MPVKHKEFKHMGELGGVVEYVHKRNDLRVLVWEDHSTPTVALNVTYLVGARNEGFGHTGATHMLEHLLFKGSRNFDNKKGKSISAALERVGAFMNATTSFDRTNYYEVVPTAERELPFRVEADRMRGALLRATDKEAEMPVVRNEFEISENEPHEAVAKALYATMFQNHPYGAYVIGLRSDVENVTVERLRQFYDDFYWPNNAYLVIVGDISVKESLELTHKHFGKIKPSHAEIPPMYTKEPPQEGPRRTVVRRSGEVPIILLGQRANHFLHADTPALELLSGVLGRGRSSRFYRALVVPKLCSQVTVGTDIFHDAGMLVVNTTLQKDIEIGKVEKIILDELEKIKREGVSESEVNRVLTQLKFDMEKLRDGTFGRAALLNEFIAMGDWKLYFKYLELLEEVTAEKVKHVANLYLGEDNRTTAIFIPK